MFGSTDRQTADRERSFPPTDSRPVAVAWTAYVAAASFVVIILWGQVLLGLAGRLGFDLGATGQTVVSSVATGLAGATLAWLHLLVGGFTVAYLDLRVPDRRDAGFVVAGVVVIYVGAELLRRLVTAIGIGTAQHAIEVQAKTGDVGFVLAMVPAAVLFTGPGEEVVYRVLIQKPIRRAFSSAGAVVGTSLAFAAAHGPVYVASGAPALAVVGSLSIVFALSLVLGALYEWTGSVVVPALTHGLYDAAVFVTLYVGFGGV